MDVWEIIIQIVYLLIEKLTQGSLGFYGMEEDMEEDMEEYFDDEDVDEAIDELIEENEAREKAAEEAQEAQGEEAPEEEPEPEPQPWIDPWGTLFLMGVVWVLVTDRVQRREMLFSRFGLIAEDNSALRESMFFPESRDFGEAYEEIEDWRGHWWLRRAIYIRRDSGGGGA